MTENTLFGELFEEQAAPAPKADATATNIPVVKQVDVAGLMQSLSSTGSARLSDHATPVTDVPAPAPKDTTAKPAKAAKPKQPKESKEEKAVAKKAAAAKAEDDKIAAEGFGAWLKATLDERAASNSDFAAVYAKPGKTLKECVLYIGSEMFKKALSGAMTIISDDVVEGLAMHYYQEDNIDLSALKNNNELAFAVCSQVFALTPGDIAKVNALANEAMVRERVEKEKERIREEIRSGKHTVTLSEQERKEIDAEARKTLIEQSAQRQKRNSTKQSALPAAKTTTTKDEQPTLF